MKTFLSLVMALVLVSFTSQDKEIKSVDVKSSTVFWVGKKVTGQHSGNITLKEGRHHLELHFGEAHIERTVDVIGDTRFVWRPNVENGTEEWSSFSP